MLNRIFLIGLSLLILGCSDDADTTASWEHSLTGLYAAAFSHDGHYAAVSSSADGASFWDLQRNKRLFDWSHNDDGDDPISMIAFSPNDSHVVTADSRSFVIWNAQSGSALGYWGVDADINDIAISNNARFVLLGLTDGRAIHINQATQRRLEVVAHQGERVTAVALTSDGSIAVTGGNDRRVMVWRAHDGGETQVFVHNANISRLDISPNDETLLTADDSGVASIWQISSGEKLSDIALPKRQHVVSASRFSADGKRLALGFPGRSVRLWDSRTSRFLKTWRTPNRTNGWVPQGSTVSAVAFDAEAATVLAQSSNGLGRAWRADALN